MEINGIKVAHNAIDWTGHKVGRLEVKSLTGRHKTRRTLLWEAECSCGNTTQVTSAELSAGDTKSCGCLHLEVIATTKQAFAEKYRTHGMSGTLEQKAWKRMKARCTTQTVVDTTIHPLKLHVSTDMINKQRIIIV